MVLPGPILLTWSSAKATIGLILMEQICLFITNLLFSHILSKHFVILSFEIMYYVTSRHSAGQCIKNTVAVMRTGSHRYVLAHSCTRTMIIILAVFLYCFILWTCGRVLWSVYRQRLWDWVFEKPKLPHAKPAKSTSCDFNSFTIFFLMLIITNFCLIYWWKEN